MKKLKQMFGKLPPIVQLVIGIALLGAVLWIVYAGYNYLSYKIPTMIDNAKDAQTEQHVKDLQDKIDQNNKKIEVLVADNAKLKKEREDQDKIIKAIDESLANDGKIIKSEQQKIDEANKKYEETKDSCATVTDTDAYVQCVCNKLAVACS